MATIIRLTKGTFEHIRKVDKVAHWEKRIAEEKTEIEKLEKRISEMKAEDPRVKELDEQLKSKKEDFEALQKLADKALEQLAKYGPTKWKIHCLPKKDIYKIKAIYEYDYDLDKMQGGRLKKVGTDFVGYQDLVSLDIFTAGFDGVENLRDPDGNIIEFTPENKEDIINGLDDTIIKELSNVMAGIIDEDEIKN